MSFLTVYLEVDLSDPIWGGELRFSQSAKAYMGKSLEFFQVSGI